MPKQFMRTQYASLVGRPVDEVVQVPQLWVYVIFILHKYQQQ